MEIQERQVGPGVVLKDNKELVEMMGKQLKSRHPGSHPSIREVPDAGVAAIVIKAASTECLSSIRHSAALRCILWAPSLQMGRPQHTQGDGSPSPRTSPRWIMSL